MIRRLVICALLAASAAGCKGRAGLGSFSNISMRNVDGSATTALEACPTPRCWVVYVAPWCGYCRAATPMIKQIRTALRTQGMESWVIVGMDKEPALREYASDFGSDALLDVDRAIDPGGVPHFFVVEKGGAILRHVAGLPPNPMDLLTFALKK